MFHVCHVVMIVVWEACTGGGGFQLHISKHQKKERQEEEGHTPFSHMEPLPPNTLVKKFEVFTHMDVGG